MRTMEVVMNKTEHAVKFLLQKEAGLFWKLDQTFKSMGERLFNPYQSKIPSLIQGKTLKELGYFGNFQGHLTCAAPHCHKLENVDLGVDDSFYLTPAVCLPLYPGIKPFTEVPNISFAMLGTAYRYENGNWDPMRAWEFLVREIVFIGSEQYVTDCLGHIENEIERFCEKNGIKIQIENSDDYFTAQDRKTMILKKLQRNLGTKREAIWEDASGKKTSLASFNFHKSHFSKTFGWDNNGEIVSGCVGFGLERWYNAWTAEKPAEDEIVI
jgi:hypothetical protein